MTAHEQGAHWSLPWIRHWTIHKHLHPSTITQYILTTATPTGMITLYCLMFPADTKSYTV